MAKAIILTRDDAKLNCLFFFDFLLSVFLTTVIVLVVFKPSIGLF